MPEMNREEIAKLEALYASNPEGRVFTHLAEAYRKAGEFERARSILEQGLTKHPAYASAHVVLGRVYADLDDTDQASASFRHVLELDPHNLVALRSLGELARSQGRTGEALNYFEELRHQDPSNTEIEGVIAELKQAPQAPEAPPAEEPAPVAEPESPEPEPSAFEQFQAPSFEEPAETPSFAAAQPAELETLPGFEDATPDYGDLVSPDIDLGWSNGAPSEAEALPGDLAEFAALAETTSPDTDDLPEPVAEPIDLSDFENIEEAPSFTSTEDPWTMSMQAAPAEEVQVEQSEPEEPTPLAEEVAALEEAPPSEEPQPEIVAFTEVETVTELIAPAEPEPLIEPEPEPEPAPAFELEPAIEAEPTPEPAPVFAVTPEPEPVTETPLMTETMAELYTEQGLFEQAAEVYRALMAERPWDPDLPIRMAEVEAKSRGESPDKEMAEEATSPWMSAKPTRADTPTPYAWTEEKKGDVVEEGPPISRYFSSLLAWRPGGRTAASEPVEQPAILDLDVPSAEPEPMTEPEPWSAPAPAPKPAAPITEPASNPVEAAFDEWFNASDFGEEPAAPSPEPEGAAAAAEAPAGGEGEDDDDLEMFRSWLQSLKK